MDRIDALPIMERITAHWNLHLGQTQHEAWMEALCSCEQGQAGTAFMRMKAKNDRAPSPAEFLAIARNVVTVDGGNKPEACPDCGGDGWVTDTHHPRHWTHKELKIPVLIGADGQPQPDECICNIVTKCHCNRSAA